MRSSSEQRGEVLAQGCHTITGTCWDHWLKGNCFPGYLRKKNVSDPSYSTSLALYHLNQGKRIIQRGESSLFTSYIYSFNFEFFLLRWKGFHWTLLFCCQPGKCLCFGDGEGSVGSSKLSFQHCCNLCSCLGISRTSLCKPLGFMVSDSAPKEHSFGTGQSLVFSIFLQCSIWVWYLTKNSRYFS